jgi:hypothetical protein
MIERTPHSQHHKWGAPVRFERKTERECQRCGMIQVTRHEDDIWTEFWKDAERVSQDGNRTPICEPIEGHA